MGRSNVRTSVDSPFPLARTARVLAIGGTMGSSLWQVLGWTAGILLVFVPLCVRKYRRLQ